MALELPDGESTRELIKCVVVGDGGVGKTKLICAQALGQSIKLEPKRTLLQCAHGSHKPSVFAIDKYYKSAEIQARSNMIIDGVPVALRLWDTFGDHQKNRRFAYQNSHVVALCFAVNCPQSLESVNDFWYNEIKNFCPRTPIILVGTKSDCRQDQPPEETMLLKKTNFSHSIRECTIVTPRMGRQIAQEIGAYYYECSVLSMSGLQDVFQNVIRAALCNQRARRLLSKPLKKVLPPQLQVPQKPPRPQTPTVELPPSTYHTDLTSLFESQFYYDLVFIVEGKEIKAHKAILVAAACKIPPLFNDRPLNGKECSSESQYVTDDGHAITIITADPSLTFDALNSLLQFLYTGSMLCNDSPDLVEAAKFLNTTITNNIESKQNDAESVFMSWKTFVVKNIRNLLFEKVFAADIWFDLEGNIIPAHKAILVSRCQMMAAMFQEGHFEEANRQIIKLPEMNLNAFLAVLEYLYTDEVSRNYQDGKVAAMAVANFFCLPRLVALYEKLIVEELETDIFNVKNVVEYLLAAEMHNATQLKAWGEHYITVNYDKMNTRALESMLPIKTARSLETRRWPPVWYLLENEWYNQAAMKEKLRKVHKKHK